MSEPTPTPSTLSALAAEVHQAHATHDAATAQAKQSRQAAVAAILAAVAPSLPAIAKPYRLEVVSGNDALRSVPDEGEVLSDWKGIRIAGAGVTRDGRRDDTRGDITGSALIWRTDGGFVTLTYSGTWSRWQGEADRWEADVEEHPALADAMTTWPELDPDAVARRLAKALSDYLAGARTRLESVQAEIDGAQAIARRLGG